MSLETSGQELSHSKSAIATQNKTKKANRQNEDLDIYSHYANFQKLDSSSLQNLPPSQNNVFERLYRRASQKQIQKVQETKEQKSTPQTPRNPIQNELIQRGLQSKAKIRMKKTQNFNKQLNSMSERPQIDKMSKSLAKTYKKRQNLEEELCIHTKNIAKTIRKSRQLQTLVSKKIKDKPLSSSTQNSNITINLTKMHQSFSSKLLQKRREQAKNPTQFQPKTPTGYSYTHILKLMQLNQSPVQIQDQHPNQKSPSNIIERMNAWQKAKLKKLAFKQKEKSKSQLIECTFSPVLCTKPNLNTQQTSLQNPSKSYNCLSPSSKRISFSSGINLKAFATKAYPMFQYKTLAIPHN